jgi:hypothetical protein
VTKIFESRCLVFTILQREMFGGGGGERKGMGKPIGKMRKPGRGGWGDVGGDWVGAIEGGLSQKVSSDVSPN